MAEKDAKPKKQSTIKQIIRIYKYTAKEDKALPWLEAGAFLLPVVVMIIIGLIAKWTWLTWIFTMITAIMLGMLLATMMLTRRADAVGYKLSRERGNLVQLDHLGLDPLFGQKVSRLQQIVDLDAVARQGKISPLP